VNSPDRLDHAFSVTPHILTCHLGRRACERSGRRWFGSELDPKGARILIESRGGRQHDRDLAESKFRLMLQG
jgi:hypothetical protein